MIVCSCQRVSEAEIRTAIAAGAASVEEVMDTCGAGLSCRTCFAAIIDILVQAGCIAPDDPRVVPDYGG